MKHFKLRPAPCRPRGAGSGTGQGESLSLAAPMKINLALHILGKRADGYHELETLAAFSGAGDRLRFSAAPRDSFTVEGPYAARLPRSRNNLVLQARNRLRALFGAARVPPVAICLRKNLPVAAGLGGGSADAAAVLAGLAAFSGLNPRAFGGGGSRGAPAEKNGADAPPALLRLAEELGADVPMCLAWFYRKTAYLAGGKGEALRSLPHFPALCLVVINSGAPLSTRAVFAALDAKEGAPLPPAQSWEEPRGFAQWAAFLQSLRNDLYEPALRIMPELAEAPRLLRASGAVYCAMSGSGASVFGLYPSMAAAAAAAAFIRARAAGYFVAAVQTDGAPAPV